LAAPALEVAGEQETQAQLILGPDVPHAGVGEVPAPDVVDLDGLITEVELALPERR
jgi:hypothetical protein